MREKKTYLGSRHAFQAPVAAAAAITGTSVATAGTRCCCSGWSGVEVATIVWLRLKDGDRPTSHNDSLVVVVGVVVVGGVFIDSL